ncbi:MAG TPA: PDZ domain-containing protein [Gemmatimonadaceae bacterium]|jgi:serine protease Do|nr:PDZ domain-containing protein [Gemmatimonadaceae bacterium]
MKRFSMINRTVVVLGLVVFTAQRGVAQNISISTDEPTGWVGVTIQAPKDNAEMAFPVITEVEPGSPAAHAGLVTGDTILKFNNVDARTVARFKPFLQPGRHVRVLVRRNGKRTVTVVVGKKPEESTPLNVVLGATQLSFSIGDGVLGSICALTPIAAPATMLETTSLAGASLAQMNADLAEVLHVRTGGVFVLNVASGTTARQAGLKAGDVITMVDTIRVNTPTAIFRMLTVKLAQDSGDQGLTLRVIRDGKPQQITLRK